MDQLPLFLCFAGLYTLGLALALMILAKIDQYFHPDTNVGWFFTWDKKKDK